MARAIIVGAGLAGLSCARALSEQGIPSLLVSMQPSERAASVMAEGGINAALDIMGQHDSCDEHFADTMRGSAYLADRTAVRGLVDAAPAIVRDLVALGVPFQVENGRMVQRYFGGQGKMRTAYAKTSTGKAIVSALIDEVRKHEAAGLVERLPHHEFLQLRLADGVCQGAWVRDIHSGSEVLLEGPVVLCAGGMGGLFGPRTTGTVQTTADVHAAVFAQGVEIANPEFFQYHPTTVAITGKRLLISEAARGEGGRLFTLRDGSPWYFMEELHDLGNLAPRDVISRTEEKVMGDPSCSGQVFLDMRGLDRRIWRERLSDLREEVAYYLGIDPTCEPIPVEPGIHYSMGGIAVDAGHRTNVAGLFAAGECACQYHGANRLGGNSLLGAIYGGRVAARTLAESPELLGGLGGAPADGPIFREGAADLIPSDAAAERTLGDLVAETLSITRSREGLAAGLAALGSISGGPRLSRRVLLARAAFEAALAREESRGAHQRSDYPDASDRFLATTIVRFSNGAPCVWFRALEGEDGA